MTQQNKTSQQHLYFFLLPVNVLFIGSDGAVTKNLDTEHQMPAHFLLSFLFELKQRQRQQTELCLTSGA